MTTVRRQTNEEHFQCELQFTPKSRAERRELGLRVETPKKARKPHKDYNGDGMMFLFILMAAFATIISFLFV